MAKIEWPREWTPGDVGWHYIPVLIPNPYIMHWFYHVHHFVCYCGGKQFSYIKDDHDELTRGGGRWYGFDPSGLYWGI